VHAGCDDSCPARAFLPLIPDLSGHDLDTEPRQGCGHVSCKVCGRIQGAEVGDSSSSSKCLPLGRMCSAADDDTLLGRFSDTIRSAR